MCPKEDAVLPDWTGPWNSRVVRVCSRPRICRLGAKLLEIFLTVSFILLACDAENLHN